MLSQLIAIAILAQTPQPFPKPGEPRPQTPSPSRPAVQAPAQVAPAQPQTPPPPPSTVEPTAATLGVSVYPGAQFLASYDAGRGQRYYLFGTNADFAEIVTYYRNALN